MNGSRSNPQRASIPSYSDRPSLDALNRTIEGLEARIEGLMSGAGRDAQERQAERSATTSDAVSEILERQRALNASRERTSLRERIAAREADRFVSSRVQEAPRTPAAPARSASAAADIAEALVGLRQELKRDISDGLVRELSALRSEIRGIKAEAQDHLFAEDIRADMQRLADGIHQLGRQASPAQADALRAEFDGLRALIDGLANEDGIRRLENRWKDVEERLNAFDRNRDDELVALAYRLDDIKSQIGALDNGAAFDGLQEKLLAIADAIELLGRQMQPEDGRLVSQLADFDARFDEISRAIAVNGRNAADFDNALVSRLESRLGDLSRQIDEVSRPVEAGLGARIEALTARIEELSGEKAATRLEERLDELSMLLESNQKNAQAELADYLADISQRIEALDQGSVNSALAERLDYLARRIDDLNMHAAPPVADQRFERLEDRLADIAQRLEETHAAPFDDREALRNLETQIANLSTLIGQPRVEVGAAPVDFESRMSALEDYLATSDEYIIEAARQAAEAVMEAFTKNGPMHASGDMAAISALAEDLRTLEDLSRSSNERTARTFEALHETLVQIAEKLELLEDRGPVAAVGRSEAAITRGIPAMPRAAQPEFGNTFGRAGLDDRDDDTERNVQVLQAEDEATVIEPASAAVDDVVVAEAVSTVEKDEVREPAPSAKTGLLAGLTRRFSGKRTAALPERVRQVVEPAPSIDPSEMLAPEDANQLLEPGSGAPDVKKILERVRAGQMSRGSQPAFEGDKADFIAAARRAAQLAVEEADTLSVKDSSGWSVAGAFARHRRPILMAVGAVLLAIMSYPLVSTVLKGKDTPEIQPAAVIEQKAVPQVAEAKAVDDRLTETAAAPVAKTQAEAPVAKAAPAPGAAATANAAPAANSVPAAKAAETAPVTAGSHAPLLHPASEPAQASASTFEVAPAVTAKAGTFEPIAKAGNVVLPEGFGPPALVTAAKGGDPLAFYEIGTRFTEGRGVKEDPAEAAKWYQRAADAGVIPAEYRLANLYEKGAGVARDTVKAKALYLKAAAAGNASATHNLAVMLASGRDGAPDFAEAAKWFEKAASLGVRDSQFNLAVLYARGNGVKQDLEESYKWFSIAARDGDKDAGEKRDEIAKAMNPEQLASAMAKADAWKVQPADAKANSVDIPDAWVGPPTKTATVDMSKAVRNIQAILNNNGFDAGTPDGYLGKKTIAAIKAFQKSIGQEPTGEITDALVRELLKRNS
ncbi:peptidoglycan-binding protein [Sinorhizobium terangae]|uniref:Peptidoglycan-binding protein n=1 Tax=Sinorhizobium terangae TaxID=110322 RepID=A0A6N7LB98_SINTE|nr:peptidoglycan-binding protein [Sinorhizobium terangae]MBB4183857.1 localization factor PodJL [Sinorhizobium terangae]MQX15117.1 peptidoglycan-binding protein [Sinorhizobium terangae]WFU47996.1 peptidoglycan-binding protein [Sinorhizobium terangae]